MSILKKVARNIVLPAAFKLGIDRLLLRKIKSGTCVVNFHGVRRKDQKTLNNRHLQADEFEKIIRYLKNNFSIVTLDEAFKIHRNQLKRTGPAVALTFDDGYTNNFEIAFPILKKYNVPATFFIITKGLEEENYIAWPDASDLLKKYADSPLKVNDVVFEPPHLYSESNKIDLMNYLKTQGAEVEKIALSLLHNQKIGHSERAPYASIVNLVSRKELLAYKNEPLLEIGSHTHTHFSLEYVSREVAETELKRSKEILESLIGKKVHALAFPDGSYKKETVQLAKALGYDNIVAVAYKLNERNQDPNVLSRFTISNSTTFESNMLRLAKTFDSFGF